MATESGPKPIKRSYIAVEERVRLAATIAGQLYSSKQGTVYGGKDVMAKMVTEALELIEETERQIADRHKSD